MIKPIVCDYSIEGRGLPLFLIHGIGAARDAWRFMIPELSKNDSHDSADVSIWSLRSLAEMLLLPINRIFAIPTFSLSRIRILILIKLPSDFPESIATSTSKKPYR